MTKICKDCVSFKKKSSGEFECHNKANTDINIVTGEIELDMFIEPFRHSVCRGDFFKRKDWVDHLVLLILNYGGYLVGLVIGLLVYGAINHFI